MKTKLIPVKALEELADKTRVKCRFSSTEPINAKTLLRRLNILAMYRPLSEKSCGLSLKTSDGKHLFMLINSNITRGRQHFTIAHEIFHLLYEEHPTPHFCNEPSSKETSEKNADMFASCLLLPRQGVLDACSQDEIISQSVSMETVLKIEQFYGVSHQAAVYRLKGLGLIPKTLLPKLLKVNIKEVAYQYGLDQSLYNTGNRNLVISDFGVKARKLFNEDKISEGHYMELLNLITGNEDKDSCGC